MKDMTLRFELFTTNPKKTVEFYTSILGFSELKSYSDYYPIQRGGVTIGICPINSLKEGHYFRPEVVHNRKGLGLEIVLEVDDIEDEYNSVKKSGYHIAEELTQQEWGLTDFRLVDPDGYYLRITSHH